MTVEQFGKALVASGLMTADDVKAFWSGTAADARPKTDADFGKLLVDKSLLTPFQVAEIIGGRGERMVMGDYTIVAQIGAGGMGQVYKAQHRRMKRTVALKVMSNAAMQDEAAVKRFQREVHAAARLEHPNIVTAYDSGESGSVKYLVMQFVDGGDLSELVKKQGRLGVEQAVGYVIQAAKGLAFAHGEGVIHRDIKPANLLLDKKGIVKILDMGLARFEDGGDGLTATEQVMGTVDYMSPEQAANTKGCDGRADIYSLGCTLWYLLTAKKAYEADTMIARLMAHRDGPLPSLVKERDDAPWPLEQALHKMIAKRVQDRYQSMDEVVAALAPFSGDPSAGGSSGGSSPSVSHNADLASFMQSIGGSGAKSSTSATQVKPATSTNIDATAKFSAPEAGTDPKSQVLPKGMPSGSPTIIGSAAKPQAAKKPGSKPAKSGNDTSGNKVKLIAAGAVGALLVIAGIIVKIRDKDGNVVAEINAPTGAKVEVLTQPQPAVKPIAPAIPVTPATSTISIAQMLDSPDYVWTTPENLGPSINGPKDEVSASLTADQTRIFFQRPDDGRWEAVRASTSAPFGSPSKTVGGGEDWLSGDGLTILNLKKSTSGDNHQELSMIRRATFDSKWDWTNATAPFTNTVSAADKRHPTMSPDGLTVIFTDYGGPTRHNLWMTRRPSPTALFEPPLKLGPFINTGADEIFGMLLGDNQTIVFNREKAWHFTVKNSAGVQLSLPLRNAPFPASDYDLWFAPDGRTAYFSDDRPGGFGGKDIYVSRLVPKNGATPQPSFVSAASPSFVTPSAPQTPPPPGDYALRLVQGGNQFEAPNPQIDVTQPFTFEAYFTPGAIEPEKNRGGRVVGIHDQFHIEILENAWRFYSTHNSVQSREPVAANRRIHIAGVRTTTGRLLFIDGKLAASKDEPLQLTPAKGTRNPLTIFGPQIDMTIDELRISQGVVYDKPFAPPAKLTADANTLALYHFDEGFDDVVKDSSGKGHDGKIIGAVWVKADGSPIPTVPTSTVPTSNGVVYLDDLPETELKVSYFGKHGFDNLGKPIEWHGQRPAHSLYMHPHVADSVSTVTYSLNGRFAALNATVALLKTPGKSSDFTFRVLGDGQELWKSPLIQNGTNEAICSVSVASVRELRLEAICHGGTFNANGVWIEPRLTPTAVPVAPAAPTASPQAIAPAVSAPRWPLAPSKPEDIAWLRSLKATLTLRDGKPGGDLTVTATQPQPAGAWTIVGIVFSRDAGAETTDQVLQRIAGLIDLESLTLSFTPPGSVATKDGLKPLAALVNLRQLTLGRIGTADTDPAFLGSFPSLQSLELTNAPFAAWEPHVARLSNLAELTLYNMSDAKLEQLGPLPRLTSLRFAGYATAHSDRLAAAKAFIPVVPWCRITFVGLDGDNAKKLVVEPTAAQPPAATTTKVDDQATVAAWLLENKKLAKTGFEVDGRRQYSAAVPTGPFKVVELNFSKFNNGGQPLSEDEVARLAVFTDLESLELPLIDSGLAKLVSLKKLKSLIVAGSELTPAAVATIRQFPQLEHLHAFGSDEWLKPLAGMPTLRSMVFWKVKVSPQAMSWFPQYPNLKELMFHECIEVEKDPNSFVAIAPLKDCKSLSKLTLAGSAIDGAELAVLSGFTQLLELNLNTPTLTEAQVKQLAAALPRCKITWTDAENKKHIFEPTAPPK